MATIETRIPEYSSGYGKPWAKVVESIEERAKNFYAYSGRFVDVGAVVDIEPGAVVVIQYFTRARGGGKAPNAVVYRAPVAGGGEWVKVASASGDEAAIELREVVRGEIAKWEHEQETAGLAAVDPGKLAQYVPQPEDFALIETLRANAARRQWLAEAIAGLQG